MLRWMTGEESCRVAPDLFFPLHDTDTDAQYAKSLCRVCPVIEECRTYALQHPVEGVWGGMTLSERKNTNRRARRRA